jgi:broad-specificity NMP kinase
MVDEDGKEMKRIVAIVVTGPVGSGKSTTAAALSGLLEEHAVPHAMVDMDHLRWVYPTPSGDRFGVRLGYRNLAAIWPNLLAAGIRCAVLADVIESREQVRDYESAMPGADVTVVRLEVDSAELARRLHGRETPETIDWYLHRAPELQEIMEREGVGDIVVDVGSRDALAIAREIIDRIGLIPEGSTPWRSPGASS